MKSEFNYFYSDDTTIIITNENNNLQVKVENFDCTKRSCLFVSQAELSDLFNEIKLDQNKHLHISKL
jgi:hypothetical protein